MTRRHATFCKEGATALMPPLGTALCSYGPFNGLQPVSNARRPRALSVILHPIVRYALPPASISYVSISNVSICHATIEPQFGSIVISATVSSVSQNPKCHIV